MRLPPLAVGLFTALSLVLAGCGNTGPSVDNSPLAAPTKVSDTPATPGPTPSVVAAVELLPVEDPPAGAAEQFSTDFSKHSVPYSDVLSGGPPKDGIPSIDAPTFVDVRAADVWLKEREPVVLVEADGVAKAYPLQILTWHEIVNDTVGDTPLTITFCPLCNTAIAFERTVNGQVLGFGTTGRLRYSNLIMYDRQTETWWQQGTGEAITGELTGTRLTFYPATIVAWKDFRVNYPDGQVLSRETGFDRDYGRNPYAGYDDVDNSPFLYRGPATPNALPAVARVLTVERGTEVVAYPYAVLEKLHVVDDVVDGQAIVVFWQTGTASALDTAQLAEGRDVGSAAAYNRQLNGQTLDFRANGDTLVDVQTGSTWNALGVAVTGALVGERLDPVIAVNHFWFSWAAFRPDTRIYQP